MSPSLVVPLNSVADHADVARAVVRAGVGATVAKDASVEELTRALTAAIGDQTLQEEAGRLADLLITRDPLDEAAQAVEELAER